MAAEHPRLRGWLGTVRVRTTLVAVAVAGLAMAVGALVLVAVLRDTLTREVGTAARLRAQDVASALASDPTGRGSLAVDDPEEWIIQVLDQGGRVVAASENAQALAPVARLPPGESAEVEAPAGGPVEEGEFLAVATGADTPLGPRTVVVARSTETVTEATAAVAGLLAIGLPLLLAVVAVTTWVVVGRALAPVEAIRSEVDAISATALHRRVPDPPADDEIGRLARTMNRMLERLERAQARQRRLVSDASHELRSPVAAIRQHAEVALAHPDRTTTSELAETVLVEDLRLQRLAEDLLLLTRADEHTLGLRRRPVDLDDLVFDEARRLRGVSGLRVDTTAVSAGRVDGDAAGLRRVLRNLGDNAVRHAGTQVAFSVAERDGVVRLRVDDDGPGIPEADRKRVFERFVRLDHARARDDGGSGLGLAIVAELVAAHGGTVAITPSPIGGTRVEVTLPRLPDPGG
ncbi:MAG TPA: HAMP domain-containing sensor histidine kinase [Actinomycetes bacterium]|nr:HAMP domain-containing sensor histidine kinase [Actinomycetes bacterium]